MLATEILWADFFDGERDEWRHSGVSPWLGDNDDHVYTDAVERRICKFGFQKPVDLKPGDAITEVKLELECMRTWGSNLTLFAAMFNGVIWEPFDQCFPNFGTYAWWTIDTFPMTNFFNTADKLANALMIIDSGPNVGGTIYVRRAKLTVTYTPGPPPPPEEPAEINLPMIGAIALAVVDAALVLYYIVTHIFRKT